MHSGRPQIIHKILSKILQRKKGLYHQIKNILKTVICCSTNKNTVDS